MVFLTIKSLILQYLLLSLFHFFLELCLETLVMVEFCFWLLLFCVYSIQELVMLFRVWEEFLKQGICSCWWGFLLYIVDSCTTISCLYLWTCLILVTLLRNNKKHWKKKIIQDCCSKKKSSISLVINLKMTYSGEI